MNYFISFWQKLLLKPQAFFKEDFKNSDSPFFLFVLMIYGFSDQLGRMDKQMLKIANGREDLIGIADSWTHYTLITILMGLMAGFLYYYIGGWWFNTRIGFCGGQKDVKSSRFIFLYSFFPFSLFNAIMFIPTLVKHNTPLDAYLSDDPIEIIVSWVAIALMFYTLRISYQGAKTVFQIDNFKTKLWFLILPAAFYFILLVALGVVMSMYDIK